MGWRIGVDAGGTFTDVCLFDEETAQVLVTKVSSTPADPGQAVMAGVREILSAADATPRPGQVSYFAHGSTVATNCLLQERGALTGLVTTSGFRDLLELGRQRRPKLYDLQVDKPGALVPRDRRLTVAERVRHDGRVERALDPEQVRAAARELRRAGVEAVGVCLLYSYLFPEHERTIREVLAAELPDAFVSISSEVLPEFREYERLSTVVTNAYVGPMMARYLARLRGNLAELGIRREPHITQSNGGVISFETAERYPVRTVLSGPSTGVVGAAVLAGQAGFSDVITFDMGGTSTDVSLVQGGQPKRTGGMELDGRPISTPMLDINTVGAGGGSIAWIDSGGHLKVGPASAGADPGPVCYGRGSEQPTVTDANVVLRALNPRHLLGGRMPIDADAAAKAVGGLADAVGMDLLETAQGIISVVVANMARAIRVISVQRGYDPRDYTLVAFGGAGPLHAARLAEELDIPRVLVPEKPGALSALGLLMTDLRTDYSRTRILPVEPGAAAAFGETFQELAALADGWFDAEEIDHARRVVRRWVELRYQGQNYELPVPMPDGPVTEAVLGALTTAFAEAHERRYGYSAPEEPVEAVTFRLEATGTVPHADVVAGRLASDPDPAAACIGTREVYLPERGGFASCPVYDRSRLAPGHRLPGPAVVEQMDSTTLVLPGQRASVDRYRNLLIAAREENR
ncbi:MAG: hydantoinase/oxoprolinase family protein [Pseudonocardia sp.]|nr:hydantoinase/oxoprolinase family protein [Pseudonocardia sp.]